MRGRPKAGGHRRAEGLGGPSGTTSARGPGLAPRGCRAPPPPLTGLRRFSVTFFQSRRWS